ncbi:MAG: hypothetical protein WCX09_02195 [Patescibacteria group bacterium]
MNTKKINQYLEELYQFDPSLKKHEQILRQLIPQLIAAKPDSGFNPELIQKIKSHLEQSLKKTNYKSMTKKIVPFWQPVLTWSAGVIAMLFLALTIYQIFPDNQAQIANKNPEAGVKKVVASAFGPLNSQGNVVTSDTRMIGGLGSANNSPSAQNAPELKEVSVTASDSLATPLMTVNTTEENDLMPTNIIGMGGGETELRNEKIMIMPIINYSFKYQGEPLDLSQVSKTVYRRIKNQNGFAIANLLSGLEIDPIKLNSFSNLKATYISLAEDKPFGLTASFDFNDDSVSIYSNWEKWANPERDKCQDEACWSRFRTKYEDIPEDSVAIQATNDFLTNLGVDISRYGEAKVNNSWRRWYEQTTDKANYYFPEIVNVVYPLLIDGQEVNNSAGEPDGLLVNYNILEKRVSDASTFTPYNYEASEYEAETSADRLINLAEAGGWNQFSYHLYDSSGEVEVENRELILGTPRQGLIRFWTYQNNASQELFAPALIFPVLDVPADYYGSTNIIVPLTQDLIKELEERNTQYSQGGVISPISISSVMR